MMEGTRECIWCGHPLELRSVTTAEPEKEMRIHRGPRNVKQIFLQNIYSKALSCSSYTVKYSSSQEAHVHNCTALLL